MDGEHEKVQEVELGRYSQPEQREMEISASSASWRA